MEFTGEIWFWRFPKDGAYLVPVKQSVRTAERLEVGDLVNVRLHVDI